MRCGSRSIPKQKVGLGANMKNYLREMMLASQNGENADGMGGL